MTSDPNSSGPWQVARAHFWHPISTCSIACSIHIQTLAFKRRAAQNFPVAYEPPSYFKSGRNMSKKMCLSTYPKVSLLFQMQFDIGHSRLVLCAYQCDPWNANVDLNIWYRKGTKAYEIFGDTTDDGME